jgi:hypothetical protein
LRSDGQYRGGKLRSRAISYCLEIPLIGGDTMLAEVTGQVDGLVAAAGGEGEVFGQLSETLTHGLDRVKGLAAETLTRLRDVYDPPNRVAMEFGVNFSAKAGVVIAQASGEAHMTVTVEWCASSKASADRRFGTSRLGRLSASSR